MFHCVHPPAVERGGGGDVGGGERESVKGKVSNGARKTERKGVW